MYINICICGVYICVCMYFVHIHICIYTSVYIFLYMQLYAFLVGLAMKNYTARGFGDHGGPLPVYPFLRGSDIQIDRL